MLNLRHIEKKLAKQNQFDEAKRIKSEADRLEISELEGNEKARKERCYRKEKALKKTHETELKAFQQRIEMGRLALLSRRISDMDKVIQRFKNLKKDVKHRHKMLKVRTGKILEKTMNNPKAVHSPFNSLLFERDMEKMAPRNGSALETTDTSSLPKTFGNDSFRVHESWCKGTLSPVGSPRNRGSLTHGKTNPSRKIEETNFPEETE